ncbi:hypothetical protein OSTOST_24439 [Ostertagia ostertagi]
MFSLALLVFFLASVIDGQEPQDKTPLPADMKAVFENLTAQYKKNLTWNDDWREKRLRNQKRHLA